MDISSILPKAEGKTWAKKKSGGFQSMGLSANILKGILKRGYKVPTPIQRKAIPAILKGNNVMAMARTGSGKTAAFLIPMLQRLRSRIPKTGARALIFSPTRELAIQTLKFTHELAAKTSLKAIAVLGGGSMEDQFTAIHESPDIIIATPGRFLHIVIEMDLKLSSVEYVVFDEADRLFEMGFQEQLQEVMNRLPSEIQTVLFSATLPKILADFIKVGIEDPMLIRLDVETQISENLKNSFFLCRSDDKLAILLYLLKHVIDVSKDLTVVFLATKHHIEYVRHILERACIPCAYIFSSLDQTARSINIAKFRTKKVGVLLVTDIAARGIDVPLLDNVINYNFPAKPKLFVHRVGRVARAGRSGRAFSLVSPDETPYLLDLHLFLGRPMKLATTNTEDDDNICGTVPQTVIDDEAEILQTWLNLTDLSSLAKVASNAYKLYIKSRTLPSAESVRRIKELDITSVQIHPIFNDKAELEKNKILVGMKKYRPNTTIFELGQLAKTHSHVMREKRKVHAAKLKPKLSENSLSQSEASEPNRTTDSAVVSDLQTFLRAKGNTVKRENKFKDPENYLEYIAPGHYKEKGLEIESSFDRQAESAVLDFTGDDEDMTRNIQNTKKWDRKKKKFVQINNTDKSRKIKTESGAWIPKSFQSDLYKKWQEKNKIKFQDQNENVDSEFGKRRKGMPNSNNKRFKTDQKGGQRPFDREMKSKEEILKARKRKEKMNSRVKKSHSKKAARKLRKKYRAI